MVKQELINYFRKGVELGNPIESLKEQLIAEGWPYELVDSASLVVRNDVNLPKPPTTITQNSEVVEKKFDVNAQAQNVSQLQPLLNSVSNKEALSVAETKGVPDAKKKNIPVGVALVSGFHFFIAISIIAIQFFVGSTFEGFFGGLMGENALVISVAIGVVLASVPAVVGQSIWTAHQWARIVAIVFSSIVILFVGISLFNQFAILNLAHVAIAIFVLLYLTISRKGKEYFHHK